MGWLGKSKALSEVNQFEMPDALWTKCPSCNETIYKKELELNLFTCFKCNHHFRIGFEEYINIIFDENSFEEINKNLKSVDVLNFIDNKPYSEILQHNIEQSGSSEAVITGYGNIKGEKIAILFFNLSFIDGSIGSVAGEKIYRIAKFALDKKIPLLMLINSNQNRTQESTLALLQLTKITSIFNELNSNGIPIISIITDPILSETATTVAMMGDLIISEPGANFSQLIKKDLEGKLKKKLLKNYPKSEFYFENGFIDLIIDRKNLRENLIKLIDWFNN